MLSQYVGQKRRAHILSASQETQRMCRHLHREDLERQALIAALLHDITKEYTYEQQAEVIRSHHLDLTDGDLSTPGILHAFTAAEIARELFPNLVDDAVAGAIRWHCTGRPDMTTLEKIMFVADFIEPSRQYENCKRVRNLFYSAPTERALDQAVLAELTATVHLYQNSDQALNRRTLNAQNYYLEENKLWIPKTRKNSQPRS